MSSAWKTILIGVTIGTILMFVFAGFKILTKNWGTASGSSSNGGAPPPSDNTPA